MISAGDVTLRAVHTPGHASNHLCYLWEERRLLFTGDHIMQGSTVVISGVRQLHGARVMASDLRASACLVLAGLAAQGETTVSRVYHLDRGYSSMERVLNSLGARIERCKETRETTEETVPAIVPGIRGAGRILFNHRRISIFPVAWNLNSF